ncbi:MAG: ATP-binding protein, partial [Desulfonatronovibrionaceae bacterium]
ELEHAREVLQRISHLREEKEELARQREKLTREMESLKELWEKKNAETDDLRRAWNSELTGMDLDPDLDPTVAARLVDRVETVRAQINHLRGAEDRLEKLHEFMHGFISEVARTCADPGLKDESSGTVLAAADNYLQKAEQEKQRRTDHQAAKKEVERLSGEYSRLQEALQQVELDKKRVRKKLEKRKTAWSRYLESIALDPEFTPDLAREALADIERAQAIIREQTELEDKKKQYEKRRQDFISRARALAAELGREEPQESSLPAFVHKLMQDLDGARSDFASHKELSGQLRQKEKALQEIDGEIQEAKSGEEELLEAADVPDAQEFLRRGRILEKRQTLLDRLQDLDRGLKRGTGESDMERVKELFSAWSLPALEEEIARLKREMEEEEARHQENIQRSGELKAEKDRLASDDDLSRLQQKKESLLEDLNRASRRWCKYVLVEHLLRRAREKYEKEQQPQVVRTAGRYLARITAGAYTGVFAPLGENSVYAVDAEGKSVSPEDLSRGTAEQLYLSLRFGYIDNSGRQGERLPVIMDDILVNFDPFRAENAAEAIAEMARESQVLYFTCHPQTLDVFKNAAPEAAVFEIGQGNIRRKN